MLPAARIPMLSPISKPDLQLPHKIETVTGGTVTIFGEPANAPIAFRVRWPIGRDAEGKLVYKSKTLPTFKKALVKAKQVGELLDSKDRPRDPKSWEEHMSRSALYSKCMEFLKNSGLDLLAACLLLAELISLLGVDRLKRFAAMYAPRLSKTVDITVEAICKDYVQRIFKGGMPQTADENRKSACLKAFESKFGRRFIGDLLAAELLKFMEQEQPTEDPFNKWLYCLRGLFTYARDMQKALPAEMPTEMEYIAYKVVPPPQKRMFDVRSYGRLGAAAPDKETLLAIVLAFRLHVRMEECQHPKKGAGLMASDFERGKDGHVRSIHIRPEVSKTGLPRDIEIEPSLIATVEALLPESGPVFTTADPFARVRALAEKHEIPWVSRGVRRSCVSHTVCAGEDIKDVAKKDGHSEDILRKHYFIAVDHPIAKVYCSIRFSLAKIRILPACSARITSKKKGH
ncbi:MAG TPA: hypothetical protein VN673_14605 [Clostridia bacterium]|nr:hypothetical protein [Clostridia bacterium]